MNGYTNHATWLTALHLQECGTEYLEPLTGRLSEDGAYADKDVLMEFVREHIHNEISVTFLGGGTLIADIVQGFLTDVNWYEIATLVKDNLAETENAE